MPFVNDVFVPPPAPSSAIIPAEDPMCNLSGTSPIDATGNVNAHFRATIVGTSTLIGYTELGLNPSATIEGLSSIFAHGRLNGEANVFGMATLPGTSDIIAVGSLRLRGKATIAGTSDIEANSHVRSAESSICSLLVTVVPAGNAGLGDKISARVVADGVTYPIRSVSYSEPRDSAGLSLQFTLQKPSDRDAILAASSFKFEIYSAGAWATIFDAGRRSAGGFSFAWIDAKPGDALEVSTIGPVTDAMNRTPLENTTYFDGNRETLSPADFPIIYDTNGTPHFQNLNNVPDLSLYDLFRAIFVTTLGFAGYRTDIPNYAIRRADFESVGTYLSGIAPFIGMFDPLIFVVGSTVWLLDSTQHLPAGFAPAYPLNANAYRTANLTENVLDADGFLLTYNSENEFDYSLDRDEDDEPDITPAPYTEVRRSRTYRDFFKISNPFVPVRTEKVSETEETRANVLGSLLTVHNVVETINLDSTGRLVNISKESTGLVPDLSDPSFPFIDATIRSERIDFTYSPLLRNSRREYLTRTKRTVRGLIVTDAENQHLGRDFRQAFVDGWRSGNLSDQQTTSYGDIELFVETVKETDRGQLEIRSRTVDYLTTPATITNQTTDARAGDISTNARGGSPQSLIVLKTGFTRSDRKFIGLSVGELPTRFGVPLCRRKLANTTNRTGSVALNGVRLQFGRGLVFELFDRDGGSVGNYIVEGRTITLNSLGTREQQTTQALEVREI